VVQVLVINRMGCSGPMGESAQKVHLSHELQGNVRAGKHEYSLHSIPPSPEILVVLMMIYPYSLFRSLDTTAQTSHSNTYPS